MADPIHTDDVDPWLRPVTSWLDNVTSVVSAQVNFLRLAAADSRVPPYLRAAASQTQEFLDQWVEAQRAAWIDWLAAFSGYRTSDPRKRGQGTGKEMVASLQNAARHLLTAQAEWARAWNETLGEEGASRPGTAAHFESSYAASKPARANTSASSRARKRTERRA